MDREQMKDRRYMRPIDELIHDLRRVSGGAISKEAEISLVKVRAMARALIDLSGVPHNVLVVNDHTVRVTMEMPVNVGGSDVTVADWPVPSIRQPVEPWDLLRAANAAAGLLERAVEYHKWRTEGVPPLGMEIQ